MSNRKTLVMLLAAAAMIAAGCTPKEQAESASTAAPAAATPAAAPAPAAAAAQPASLDGTSWVLAALPGKTLVDGVTATIAFQDGRAAGSDGCNRFMMPYTVEGSKIQFPGQGAGTMMACPPEVQQQAQAFTQALAGAQGWQVADGRLVLSDAGGAELVTFTEVRQDLAGTAWNATGINNGRQALVSLAQDSAVTMEFSTDGRVSGSAGCNRFNAGFEQTGKAIKFTPPVATRMACADPKVAEQETAFLNALVASTAVEVEGNRLTLRDGGGAMQVTATRK